MELSAVVAMLSALGVGGLLGACLQSWFARQNELKAKERDKKQHRYEALTIQMITKLEPARMGKLREYRPDLLSIEDLDDELKVELLNSMMFASDDVVNALAAFILHPSYQHYFKTVKHMRQDLWKTRTKLNQQLLEEILK